MATWNTATFEATPAAANSPSLFPTEMHNTRTEIRSRADQEHNFNLTPSDGNCYHRPGAAVAYYAAAAPTTRPDGTALSASDYGRIFIDSDIKLVPQIYNGSSFANTDYVNGNLKLYCQPWTTEFYQTATFTITTTIPDTNVIFKTALLIKATGQLPRALPDGYYTDMSVIKIYTSGGVYKLDFMNWSGGVYWNQHNSTSYLTIWYGTL